MVLPGSMAPSTESHSLQTDCSHVSETCFGTQRQPVPAFAGLCFIGLGLYAIVSALQIMAGVPVCTVRSKPRGLSWSLVSDKLLTKCLLRCPRRTVWGSASMYFHRRFIAPAVLRPLPKLLRLE